MPALQIQQWSHDPNQHSIAQHITRINEQHESFRDVTEKVLEKKIVYNESAVDDDHEVLSQSGDDNIPNISREEVWKCKEEILSNIKQAHTESAFSRDLVSLALFKSQRSQGQLTISQPLKDHVPPGSIGEEAVQLQVPDKESQTKDRYVTGGLEQEAFNSTIACVIAAADRLENETQLEKRFWQDAKQIKKQGWSIQRMPSEKHTLGVRIGSLEAGPKYRRKGLVELGRSPQGDIDLRLPDTMSSGRLLRVRIIHKGNPISSTNLSGRLSTNDGSIQTEIKRARDSLFDEELFYELSREASTLWSRGIKFTNQGIVMPIERDIDAVMDLADQEKNDEIHAENSDLARRFKFWPEAFVSSLRILLCHARRLNRHRRAELPRGLTAERVPQLVPPLVSPLLSQMQYYSALEDISHFVNDIKVLFSKAKLVIGSQSKAERMRLRDTVGAKTSWYKSSFIEQLTHRLSNLQPSSFEIQLPLTSTTVRAMFRVSESGIEYRYIVSNTSYDSLFHKLPSDMTFQSASELKSAILDLMRVGLVEIIQANVDVGMWQSATPQTGVLQRKRQSTSVATSSIRIHLSQFTLRIDVLKGGVRQNTVSETLTVESKSNTTVDLLNILENLKPD